MIAIGTKAQIEALELKSRKRPDKRWSDIKPFNRKFWIQLLPFNSTDLPDITVDDILDDNKVYFVNEYHFNRLRAGLNAIDMSDIEEPPDTQPEIREEFDDSETPESFDFTLIPAIGDVSAAKIEAKGFTTLSALQDWLVGTDLDTACEYFDLSENQIQSIMNYHA